MDLRNLYRIAVFQKVVEQGNFTRAADELHISKSVVSEHVTELERELNIRLLNRSTRSVSVTREGYRLAEAAAGAVHLIGKVLEEIEQEQRRPSGLIRLTASQNFISAYLVHAVLRFRIKFPEMRVEIDSRDTITNLLETGYDLAFRIGWLKSSELHAIKICDFEMVPCASPGHIYEFGPLKEPNEVSLRPWVAISILPDPDCVTLTSKQGEKVSVQVDPVLQTNSGMTAKQLILEGSCVGLLPNYAIRDELRSGRIIRVLPDWFHRPGQIAATFVHRKRMSPRLRAFIDFLKTDALEHFLAD